MSEFIKGRVESAKRSLIERAKATLRKYGEPCPDAQAAEIERLTRERDEAMNIGPLFFKAEARATAAEAAKDRAWALYNHQSEARVAVTAERDAALARATAAEADAARLLPWARLGSAIMQDYPEYGSLDGFDIQDLAEAAGVLVKINGGFDPEKHHDITGEADPGSDWYEMLGRPDALATERKP